MLKEDINVLALVKGEERYIFLYDDERKSETLRILGRFASNPELSFSWYDAAVLSQRIRQAAAEQNDEIQDVLNPSSQALTTAGPIAAGKTLQMSKRGVPGASTHVPLQQPMPEQELSEAVSIPAYLLPKKNFTVPPELASTWERNFQASMQPTPPMNGDWI